MRGITITWIFMFTVCQIKAQNPVAFPSEFIDFKIDSNYFSINGIYTFRNNTDKFVNTNILFPFTVKAFLIDSIRIINLKYLRTVIFKKHDQAISFNLQLSPYDTVEVNIFYRQQLARKKFIYTYNNKILGSTLGKSSLQFDGK